MNAFNRTACTEPFPAADVLIKVKKSVKAFMKQGQEGNRNEHVNVV